MDKLNASDIQVLCGIGLARAAEVLEVVDNEGSLQQRRGLEEFVRVAKLHAIGGGWRKV